jgi:hypothetical protein
MLNDSEDRVTIADVADELQAHRPTIFKIVRRLGIDTQKRRDKDRGNQQVDTIASSDIDRVREALLSGRRAAATDANALIGDGEIGYFYLVQLEPDHDSGRFKVGFTTDIDGRMTKHRCSAPFAVCIRYWPCRRTWERAAIDCITSNCERLNTEVFRTADLASIVRRCDAFFSLMPKLSDAPADEGI